MAFFVYILCCSDSSLYTGSTNDIEKRLHQHNHLKSGAHYTKIRRPVTLAHSEVFETYSSARKREAEIKRMTKKEKLHLIQISKKNPSVHERPDLFKEIVARPTR